jgi:hypothetical protein
VLEITEYDHQENVSFNFPANTTGDDITTKFTFFYYDENGDLSIEEDVYITQLGQEFYLLKEDNSFLLQERLFKIFL